MTAAAQQQAFCGQCQEPLYLLVAIFLQKHSMHGTQNSTLDISMLSSLCEGIYQTTTIRMHTPLEVDSPAGSFSASNTLGWTALHEVVSASDSFA